MEIRVIFLLNFFYLTRAYLSDGRLSISITRHHKGDIFTLQGEKHYKDLCVGLSSGTAEPTEVQGNVREDNGKHECQCQQHLPVYRDDLNICVDDLQECTLVPFVSGSTSTKIPYVFLPLKGQIVYPSAELIVSENGAPVCVVSGGQFLGRNGWLNLRNNSETEPPFRLFRDEERTYLQWFGETSMRMAMEGRIIMVHLMCKDASIADEPKIFTPCIAFRVAGNPSLREVMFATDVHLAEGYSSGGLSTREYVAIGLCSLFLAVVYVASIFLYLHWRKQKMRKPHKNSENETQLTLGEEGIIKNNPLLQGNRHLIACGEDNGGYVTDSNSCCSDSEQISDLLCLDDEDLPMHQNVQTSAIVHPCDLGYAESMLNQDPNSIERLPEENVSIVETLETREAHPETIREIASSNGRRKLYFNPSYFEPELLKAPPPAALEFLIKIREVIAIAKHKMSNKKFSPSLLGIPEEESSLNAGNASSQTHGSPSVKDGKSGDNCNSTTADASKNGKFKQEFYASSDVKQRIIQKWLEDVPVMMFKGDTDKEKMKDVNRKKITDDDKLLRNSNFWQTNETVQNSTAGVNATKPVVSVPPQERKRPSTKARAPPLPTESALGKSQEKRKNEDPANHSKDCNKKRDFPSKGQTSVHPPHPPPLPQSEVKQESDIFSSPEKTSIQSNLAKNLMDAVIQELTDSKIRDKAVKTKDVPTTSTTGTPARDVTREEITHEDTPGDFNLDRDKANGENKSESVTVGTTETNPRGDAVKDNINAGQNEFGKAVADEHEYETILLNPDEEPQLHGPSRVSKTAVLPGTFERNKGYSLVSEIYVNDSYDSPAGSVSNVSVENEKISYEVTNEKTSRLTIHVKDSRVKPNEDLNESDNFEPDTLERKNRRTKCVQRIADGNDERYSNQRFHDLDRSNKPPNSDNNENFTDSLERPTILLKTNGSFKRNSLEKDVNELFRNLNWTRMKNFGSLREIYEAKSRHHRKRTETTSLIDVISNSDNDCVSTLSWCEDRRNKLLHRGIVLHIDEDPGAKQKERIQSGRTKNGNLPGRSQLQAIRPSPGFRSRSTSPIPRSKAPSPTLKMTLANSNVPVTVNSPLRSPSPPLPFPRSLPVSPCHPRSATSSPVNTSESGRSACATPPLLFVHNGSHRISNVSTSNKNNNSNTMVRVVSKNESGIEYHSAGTNFTHLGAKGSAVTIAPPRPPKLSIPNSPPLPPRNSKPPLPPKSTHAKHKSHSSKFAHRPLPPLPDRKDTSSPGASYRDPETMSTASGASIDSLNSSEYESFYTIPYEEREYSGKDGTDALNNFMQNSYRLGRSKGATLTSASSGLKKSCGEKRKVLNQLKNQRTTDGEKRTWRTRNRALPHRLDDSGYLSTDSSESYCPQMVLSSHIPRIPEKVESLAGQNSETEESICDGASESGAESTATDSFFYGNFRRPENGKTTSEDTSGSYQPYTQYSLRLSDVEVNSDTERHCVPIMVRP